MEVSEDIVTIEGLVYSNRWYYNISRNTFNWFVMKCGLFSAISCCSSSHPPSTFNKRSLNTELDNVNFKIVGGSDAVPGENTYQVSILSFK